MVKTIFFQNFRNLSFFWQNFEEGLFRSTSLSILLPLLMCFVHFGLDYYRQRYWGDILPLT